MEPSAQTLQPDCRAASGSASADPPSETPTLISHNRELNTEKGGEESFHPSISVRCSKDELKPTTPPPNTTPPTQKERKVPECQQNKNSS